MMENRKIYDVVGPEFYKAFNRQRRRCIEIFSLRVSIFDTFMSPSLPFHKRKTSVKLWWMQNIFCIIIFIAILLKFFLLQVLRCLPDFAPCIFLYTQGNEFRRRSKQIYVDTFANTSFDSTTISNENLRLKLLPEFSWKFIQKIVQHVCGDLLRIKEVTFKISWSYL